MKTSMNGNQLVLCLEGTLDSSNAELLNQEIQAVLSEHPGTPFCIDADNLLYVSSSGLRMFLQLQKKYGKQTILNVSPEVYEIFDITGFTSLMDVRKRMRVLSIEGCDKIGEGAFADVYRLNADTIVKVYRGSEEMLPLIEDERVKARSAFLHGIPTAIPFDTVRVGEHYGSVFEMINARNCNDLVRENPAVLDDIIPRYTAFLKNIHLQQSEPGAFPSARDRFLEYLQEVSSALPESTAVRIRTLLENLPEDLHIVHGDAHLKNIMLSGDDMIVIDMDKLCTGNPVFEFAGLYAAYIVFGEDDPDDIRTFLGIEQETADRFFYGTLKLYLENPDDQAMEEALRKVRLAGYLRFLYIRMVEHSSVQSELKNLQIQHTSEHLTELAGQVASLEI